MPTWEKPSPQHRPFLCIAAWHLHKSALCLAIYDLLGSITTGGKNTYYTTIAQAARYFYPGEMTEAEFNSKYEVTRRAFKTLRRLGWLELVPEKGRDAHRWVGHEEWVEKHPDACRARPMLPWQIETDPLVGKLYAISGGKLRVFEPWLISMRKNAKSDDEIEALVREGMRQAGISRVAGDWVGTSPKSVLREVMRHLKERGEQERAEEYNTPSVPDAMPF